MNFPLLASASSSRSTARGPVSNEARLLESRVERGNDVDIQYNISWVLPRALKKNVREIGKRIDRQLAYPRDQRPSIAQVHAFDPATNGWRADAWRAGGTLRLLGLNLKFDDAADEQGVFLSLDPARRAIGERNNAVMPVIPNPPWAFPAAGEESFDFAQDKPCSEIWAISQLRS